MDYTNYQFLTHESWFFVTPIKYLQHKNIYINFLSFTRLQGDRYINSRVFSQYRDLDGIADFIVVNAGK
ncbi:hypothetical protein C8R27_1445 [Nitrosomonas ureae]|nr:hypothetical protein C8R27_1445 [Nitrosomonas ureae]